MPSQFGWVDFAEADRERMLNVVHLFSVQDARDELGLGTIRDAYAEYFFPGTSTIQTRARYFLFVPWTYQALERNGVSSSDVARQARKREVELIKALLAAGETTGVIGQDAQDKLQRLPSAIYWAGLGAWGIRMYPGSQAHYHRSLDGFYRRKKHGLKNDDKEPLDGLVDNWHRGLPKAPDGFPKGAVFKLTYDEASYLMDRIVLKHGNSLLAKLLQASATGEEGTKFFWEHSIVRSLDEQLSRVSNQARCFSEIMHGAALMYNLLLAKQRDDQALIARYDIALADWMLELRRAESRFVAWVANLSQCWSTAPLSSARIHPATISFVEQWTQLVFNSELSPQVLAQDQKAIDLITNRELRLKGPRARLSNLSALNLWSGAAGTGQLDFRWGIAQVLVEDIRAGLRGSSNA